MTTRRTALALSWLAIGVILAGLAGFALRLRRSPKTALAHAQAAHARCLSNPEDRPAFRNSYRSLMRLVECVDALSLDRRTEDCQEAGLRIEMDPIEETGLCRFTVADKVPAHRLIRWHLRPGIGVPVVAWRPNDNSDQWDMLRPPEGISAPATAVLQQRTQGEWTLRFLSPYRRQSISLAGRTYPLAANFSAPIAKLSRQAEGFRRAGFRGMLDSSSIARREKLYLMQRYDPKRIPLLMVHGLQSTPVSFPFACEANTRSVLNDIYLFERETRVKRAILVSVPHRGSPIADNWIGNLGQSLYHADRQVQDAFRSLLENHLDQINPFIVRLVREGRLSSIRTLSANSPALMALAEIPPAIPFHSIIGQRNPGPVYAGNDGVVAYTSSHLEGAESEVIVRFGHETFLHPDAVSEIKRILHAHLETF